MTTYFSFDIDYFATLPDGANHAVRFLNKVRALEVPTVVSVNHDEIIGHVNSFPCDRLINMDAHSDIVDDPEQRIILHIGNWVNHVSWKDTATFLWIYPSKEAYLYPGGEVGYGRCDMGPNDRNPFLSKYSTSLTGWKKVSRKLGGTKKIPADVVAVGISLSPEFLEEKMLFPVLRHLLSSKMIPEKQIEGFLEDMKKNTYNTRSRRKFFAWWEKEKGAVARAPHVTLP